MKFQFEIFQANFNYLANIAIKDYEQDKTKDNLLKTSLLWKVWSYTSMLLTEYNLLEDKYKSRQNDLIKENQKLKKQLDEIYKTTKLRNLQKSRYTKKNV